MTRKSAKASIALLALAAFPAGALASSDVANPLFSFTHLAPSPFTVRGGTLALGTNVSLGVTDFLEIGTNVFRDFYKIFNVGAKVALVDTEEFALAAFAEYETYNLQDIESINPDLRINSWLPGLVAGFSPIEHLAFFVAGSLNISNEDVTSTGIQTSGYAHGARLQSDVSWAYNPRKKSVGNVLSGGISYDVNYDIFGFGVSHHWGGFQLGVHYYPHADRNKVQPILIGGASVPL